MHVAPLHEEHQYGCQYRRTYGRGELHPRVGHHHEEGYEDKRQDYERQQFDQNACYRAEDDECLQVVGCGVCDDTYPRHDDDNHGNKEHHRQVVGQKPADRSLSFYLPDDVENILYIVDKTQHTIEHEQQPDADKQACLCMLQVGVGQ